MACPTLDWEMQGIAAVTPASAFAGMTEKRHASVVLLAGNLKMKVIGQPLNARFQKGDVTVQSILGDKHGKSLRAL